MIGEKKNNETNGEVMSGGGADSMLMIIAADGN